MAGVNRNNAEITIRINDLVRSNEKIVGSIDEISASTQQSSAGSEEVNAMMGDNVRITKEMKDKIQRLLTQVRQFGKYRT
jgi:methyl-accepting chemotaxis protein